MINWDRVIGTTADAERLARALDVAAEAFKDEARPIASIAGFSEELLAQAQSIYADANWCTLTATAIRRAMVE